MMMRPSALLVATVALAMGITACGSGGGETSASGPTGKVTTYKDITNPDLAPVKVGAIAPIGTANTDLKEMPAALAAGITALNARGGLNGHRVEMVFCNDKDDPNEGVRCARRMADEGVVAMVGMAGGSIVGEKVQPILEQAGIPLIGVDSSTPLVWNGKNAYLTTQPAPMNYQALIAYAVRNDLLPMAVAAADNPAGLQFAEFLEATLKKLTGGQGFAQVVPVADNTADYAPIAGALSGTRAKSVLNIIGTQQQLGLGRAIEGQGAKPVMLTVAPLSNAELADAGPFADLVVTAFSYPPFGNATLARFRDEMTSAEAAGNEDASLRTASPYATYPWVALQALERATKGVETITAQSVGKALDQAKEIDLEGIVPPWTPSKPGPEGMSRVSNPASWFAAFENGEMTVLADTPVSAEDLMAGRFNATLPPGVRRH